MRSRHSRGCGGERRCHDLGADARRIAERDAEPRDRCPRRDAITACAWRLGSFIHEYAHACAPWSGRRLVAPAPGAPGAEAMTLPRRTAAATPAAPQASSGSTPARAWRSRSGSPACSRVRRSSRSARSATFDGQRAVVVKSRAATAGAAALLKHDRRRGDHRDRRRAPAGRLALDTLRRARRQADDRDREVHRHHRATSRTSAHRRADAARPRDRLRQGRPCTTRTRRWRSSAAGAPRPGTTRAGVRRRRPPAVARRRHATSASETIGSALGNRRAIVLRGRVVPRASANLSVESDKPARTFTVWLSDDADRVPLKVVAHTELGDIVMDLTEYNRRSGLSRPGGRRRAWRGRVAPARFRRDRAGDLRRVAGGERADRVGPLRRSDLGELGDGHASASASSRSPSSVSVMRTLSVVDRDGHLGDRIVVVLGIRSVGGSASISYSRSRVSGSDGARRRSGGSRLGSRSARVPRPRTPCCGDRARRRGRAADGSPADRRPAGGVIAARERHPEGRVCRPAGLARRLARVLAVRPARRRRGARERRRARQRRRLRGRATGLGAATAHAAAAPAPTVPGAAARLRRRPLAGAPVPTPRAPGRRLRRGARQGRRLGRRTGPRHRRRLRLRRRAGRRRRRRRRAGHRRRLRRRAGRRRRRRRRPRLADRLRRARRRTAASSRRTVAAAPGAPAGSGDGRVGARRAAAAPPGPASCARAAAPRAAAPAPAPPALRHRPPRRRLCGTGVSRDGRRRRPHDDRQRRHHRRRRIDVTSEFDGARSTSVSAHRRRA